MILVVVDVIADRSLRFGRAEQIHAGDRGRQLLQACDIASRQNVSDEKRVTKRIDRFIVVVCAELFTEQLRHHGREVRNYNLLLSHPRAQTIGRFETRRIRNTNCAAELQRREDVAMQRIVRQT